MSQLTKKAFTPKQSMPTNEAMQGVDNSPSEPTVGAVRAFGAPAPDLLSAPADVPALAVRCKHHPGQIFNKVQISDFTPTTLSQSCYLLAHSTGPAVISMFQPNHVVVPMSTFHAHTLPTS